MENLLDKDSSAIFKLVLRQEQSQIILDYQMLQVITQLDGQKSISQIARKIGIDLDTVKKVIYRLLKNKLIELVDNSNEILGEDFFKFLDEQLSLATGPLSNVLIEDTVAELGHKVSNFPKHQALDLIDLLAEKIHREDKKVFFKQTLLEKILMKEA